MSSKKSSLWKIENHQSKIILMMNHVKWYRLSIYETYFVRKQGQASKAAVRA